MKRLIFTLALLAFLEDPSLSLAQTTVTLNSTQGVDGFVTSGGSVLTNTQTAVGDTAVNTGVRGFVSFDIGSIPPGRTILSATLRMFQEAVNGTPYTDLGNIKVDHIDYGPTLDGADYSLPALEDDIGTISENATLEFKTLNVTESLQDDMDHGRTRSQYRLLFPTQTDNDSVEDAAFFTSANIGGHTPELGIIYEGPPIFPQEGTTGTEITLVRSGLSGFGAKKGKVFLGPVALKVLTWNDEMIQCLIKKPLPPSSYDITILPKSAAEIVLPDAFSVEDPRIDSISVIQVGGKAKMTISGYFFGTKKGKVALGVKNCKVLGWAMDPPTGESEISIEVPEGLPSGTYDLTVTNQVGSDTKEGAFIVP